MKAIKKTAATKKAATTKTTSRSWFQMPKPFTVSASSSSSSWRNKIDKSYISRHAKAPLWYNENSVVHILTTRFMQMQPDLLDLGKARLDLFQTFTLPSVLGQSTDQFLWLIFTDPNLHPDLAEPLVDLVKDYDFILVLGLNQNFKDFEYQEHWMEDVEKVFSGDIQRLYNYHAAAKTHVLLETRLDADDAIFRDMMWNVQLQASRTLGVQAKEAHYNPAVFVDTKPYLVLCAEHHLEWGYFDPWGNKNMTRVKLSSDSASRGHLFGIEHSSFCITAGLTYAYQVGTKSVDLPTRAHHKLSGMIPQCPRPGQNELHQTKGPMTNCIARIDQGTYPYAIIRSRAPTSTGMKGVVPTKQVVESKEWPKRQAAVWQFVIERNFAIPPSTIFALRQRFHDNMKSILKDAIKGHCTKQEFTCHEEKTQTLKKLLAEVNKYS